MTPDAGADAGSAGRFGSELVRRARRLVRGWFGTGLPVSYHADYRLPLPTIEARTGMQPRRAAWVLDWLVGAGIVARSDISAPELVTWADLARVHGAEWLEALTRAGSLAEVFAVDPREIPVDEVVRTLRRATGGTLAAARRALAQRGPALNLVGGFHHAAPNRGVGFCAVNDIAVAVAVLRSEGFEGTIAVLDLDAHQPDGTAACLSGTVWIGSISGSSWGELEGVDEIVLPHADDRVYLAALDALLARLPAADLTFVVAGGDVLAGDPFGLLALTEAGARERDVRVYEALRGRASVWLPGGGYREDAWRVLAGTALVLAGEPATHIPRRHDPMAAGFGTIFRSISDFDLTADDLGFGDVEATLRRGHDSARLLGFYSAAGAELALERYGILRELRRLGYADLRVALDRTGIGERIRLFGRADGAEHLLVEGVFERRLTLGRPVLFVHWLTLRHPRGAFSAGNSGTGPHRPALPGQECPGLGLAREAGALLARMAERLDLAGVAFRPAWYHVAYAARHRMRFSDPERQERFEALVRDTALLPLRDVTCALAEGRVFRDGEVYRWEPDEMVEWLDRPAEAPPIPEDRTTPAARFTVQPAAAAGPAGERLTTARGGS